MAERLKHKFLEEEKIVDMVVGPDAYKDLPNLLSEVDEGRDAVNVILSKEETYGDIAPIRIDSNGVSAFVSITRVFGMRPFESSVSNDDIFGIDNDELYELLFQFTKGLQKFNH